MTGSRFSTAASGDVSSKLGIKTLTVCDQMVYSQTQRTLHCIQPVPFETFNEATTRFITFVDSNPPFVFISLQTDTSRGWMQHLTYDHVLAVLAVGGLSKNMVLEAVGDLRLGGFGGQGWGQTEGGGMGGDGEVGAERWRDGWRAVADER